MTNKNTNTTSLLSLKEVALAGLIGAGLGVASVFAGLFAAPLVVGALIAPVGLIAAASIAAVVTSAAAMGLCAAIK